MDIKSQLYSYYLDILSEISNYSYEKIKKFQNLSFDNLNISELVDNIKDSNNELINLKVSDILTQNKNNKTYFQLENYTKKLEYDIKMFYRKFFEYKIKNNILEDKIKIYGLKLIEYEELKEKVKYVDGKFLNNEKKENEILILRQENNILKKEINKLENINKANEVMKNKLLDKINILKNEKEQLIKKLELKYNSNNTIKNYNTSNSPNINININNNENNLSKYLHKYDIDNGKNNINKNANHKNNNHHLNSIKNLFKKKSTLYNNRRPANYNIIKNIYMSSNNIFKNNINSSTINKISSNNIYTSNYNKIINNFSNKNKKNSNKKKYNTIKNNRKNNSISMKIDKDEEKSNSINKYMKSSNDSKYIYISDRKNKKTVMNFRSAENGPMSCQNKTSSKIRKYLNKKIRSNNYCNELKNKKNNSALNIKINSKS